MLHLNFLQYIKLNQSIIAAVSVNIEIFSQKSLLQKLKIKFVYKWKLQITFCNILYTNFSASSLITKLLKVNLYLTVITLVFVSEALIKTWSDNEIYCICA